MKRSFRTATLAGAVIVGLGVSSIAAANGRPDLVMAGLNAGQPHQTGELIVQYRDGVTPAARPAVSRNLPAQNLQTLRAGNSHTGETTLVTMTAGISVSSEGRQVSSDPVVRHARWNT